MLSYIRKTNIFRINVEPVIGVPWNGLFNFKPNAEDVATAMRQDIAELDEEVEHEADMIQHLRQTLELVTFYTPALLGEVVIAGTPVGEISITVIRVFEQAQQSMMPVYADNPVEITDKPQNPCGEVVLDASDMTNNGKVQSELWRGVPEGTPADDLTLEEHVLTDPRTGENF